MSHRWVGYVVGEVDTKTFTFVSDRESFPSRHEYLVIPAVDERAGEGFKKVDVLAQVTRVANYSDIIGENLSLQELHVLLSRYDAAPKVFGNASVLGYMDEGEVRYPRSAAIPGQEVYVAPDDLLERFFTKEIEYGIDIGTLITRDEVRVKIDPNGFRRHVAIIAQTGAGKSYLVGLVLEKLLPMGATVIVFDPNSDYVMMRRNGKGDPTEFAECIDVYRPPGVRGRRYTNDEIGGAIEYTINFSSLSSDEISEVAGIPEQWRVIREAIDRAVRGLEGIYGPQQLIDELTNLATNADRRIAGGAERALTYVRRLLSYGIWGHRDIPLDDLVGPNKMSIVDLAGLQRKVSEYIVEKTLSEVWNRAVTGELDYPIFIVLEEAHNFAPHSNGGNVGFTIDRIAAEGRKFKIFLLVVTQRPKKISENVLSQCNSQIIMRLTNPEDQNYVRRLVPDALAGLMDMLPSVRTGEALVVGDSVVMPTRVLIDFPRPEPKSADVKFAEHWAKGIRGMDVDRVVKRWRARRKDL